MLVHAGGYVPGHNKQVTKSMHCVLRSFRRYIYFTPTRTIVLTQCKQIASFNFIRKRKPWTKYEPKHRVEQKMSPLAYSLKGWIEIVVDVAKLAPGSIRNYWLRAVHNACGKNVHMQRWTKSKATSVLAYLQDPRRKQRPGRPLKRCHHDESWSVSWMKSNVPKCQLMWQCINQGPG